MNIIFEILKYFNVFKKILGAKILFILIFTILSTFAEAFGIMLILPLLNVFNDESFEQKNNLIFDFINIITPDGVLIQREYYVSIILIFICTCFIIKGVLYFISLSLSAYMRGRLLEKLKFNLIDGLSFLNYSTFIQQHSGFYSNIINEQINRSLISFQKLMLLFGNIFSAVIFTVCAFYSSYKFGLLALVCGVLLIILLRGLSFYVRSLSRKAATVNSSLANVIIQFVQSFKYLRSTSQFNCLDLELRKLIKKLVSFEIKTAVSAAFTQSIREPIAVIIIVLSVAIHMFYFNNEISSLIVSLALFYKCFTSVFRIQSTWQNVLEYIGSLEHVNDVSQKFMDNKENNSNKLIKSISSIEFKNVSFKYDNSPNSILENISFKLPTSKTIAFVGKSGCGKTTLADLTALLLNPSSGAISINGIDSNALDKTTYRNKIGYVSQETIIFNGTILYNITMGSYSHDKLSSSLFEKRLNDVCADASILDFIKSLPNGFNTIIGDRGVNLSGGQTQRIFIARELYRQPELLILDEATCSLDKNAELDIQQSIDLLKGKLTIILIAHRFSTIINADLIYVIKNGSIKESGTFEKLSNDRDSYFYSLT